MKLVKHFPDAIVEAAHIVNLKWSYGDQGQYIFQASSKAAAELFKKAISAWSQKLTTTELQRMVDDNELVCIANTGKDTPNHKRRHFTETEESIVVSPIVSRMPYSAMPAEEKFLSDSRSMPRMVGDGELGNKQVTIDNSLPALEWRECLNDLLRHRESHINDRAAQNAMLKRKWEEEDEQIERDRRTLEEYRKRVDG